MSQSTEPLPFEMPPTDPSDPRYESHRAMLRQAQQNWKFLIEHEAEIFEHHPDDIAVVYGGNRVHYCEDAEAVVDFLETLDETQRPAAHLCTSMSSDVAWAL